MIPGQTSTGVLKARHGVACEVGIANKQLTSALGAQLQLLRNFSDRDGEASCRTNGRTFVCCSTGSCQFLSAVRRFPNCSASSAALQVLQLRTLNVRSTFPLRARLSLFQLWCRRL